MIEVYPGLFVGSRMDYETIVSGQDGWAIVHACRSYHRMAVGYRVWSVAKGPVCLIYLSLCSLEKR